MKTLCIAVFLLVVNIQWIAPSEISEPLEPFQRLVLPENPLIQFAKYIENAYMKKNDRSISDVESRFSSQDPLEVFLNFVVLSQQDRLSNLQDRIGAVKNDMRAVTNLLNSELGGHVFLIANNRLGLDADGIANLIQSRTLECIRDNFKNNPLLQLSLSQAVKSEISKQLPDLRQTLKNNFLPLGDVQKVIAAVSSTNLGRSRRDLAFPLNIVVSLVRSVLSPVITPIYNSINEILTNISSTLLTLYVSDPPSNTFLEGLVNVTNSLVLSATQTIVSVQDTITTVYTLFINGASSSSRKRRDAELDVQEFLKVLDVDERGVEVIHRRLRRSTSFWTSIGSAISSVFTFIWNIIETVVSTIFSSVTSVISTAVSLVWTVISSVASTLWNAISSALNLVEIVAAYVSGGISGVISYLWGVICENANTYIKEWFVSWISSYYEEIGESVTYPLRWVVNWVVNLVFTCSSCSDIV